MAATLSISTIAILPVCAQSLDNLLHCSTKYWLNTVSHKFKKGKRCSAYFRASVLTTASQLISYCSALKEGKFYVRWCQLPTGSTVTSIPDHWSRPYQNSRKTTERKEKLPKLNKIVPKAVDWNRNKIGCFDSSSCSKIIAEDTERKIVHFYNTGYYSEGIIPTKTSHVKIHAFSFCLTAIYAVKRTIYFNPSSRCCTVQCYCMCNLVSTGWLNGVVIYFIGFFFFTSRFVICAIIKRNNPFYQSR